MGQVIGSLDRGLRILDMLGTSTEPLGVAEIAGELDVDKSTAYRLLQTLQARQYVRQVETGQYRLGSKCIQLGSQALKTIDVRAQARPFLEELADQTGQTVHLATMVGDRAVYVGRVQGRSVITISTEVGMEAPGHCSASGKALFAYLPDKRLEEIFNERKLHQYTAKTITDLAALKKHLRQVIEQGYAIDDEERYPGVRCVAAPVFNHQGQVVASLSVSSPSSQVDLNQIEALKELVVNQVGKLSAQLGYDGQPIKQE